MNDIGELLKKLNDSNCINIVGIARTASTNTPLGVALKSLIVSFAEKAVKLGMTKHDPNKITATMKLVVTGEFYDDEASEETLRYCIEQDLEDAGFEVNVSLLKEQEPRVLTLDEAVDGNYCYYVEFRYHLDCGWVKCDFDKMYLNGEVAMLFLRDRTFYQQREHYGKLWRLWNKQPTYEQKMAVKWE